MKLALWLLAPWYFLMTFTEAFSCQKKLYFHPKTSFLSHLHGSLTFRNSGVGLSFDTKTGRTSSRLDGVNEILRKKIRLPRVRFSPLIRIFRPFIFSFLLMLALSSSISPRCSASQCVTPSMATSSSRTYQLTSNQKMSYADKLVQKYVEKYMFQDDHYDPFESTYKEIIWNERIGNAKPMDQLEDFSEVGVAAPSVQGGDTRQDRGDIQQNRKKRESFSLWSIFLKMNTLLTTVFHTKLSLQQSKLLSFYILSASLIGGTLVGGQLLFFQLKNFLFQREGERYGGRE